MSGPLSNSFASLRQAAKRATLCQGRDPVIGKGNGEEAEATAIFIEIHGAFCLHRRKNGSQDDYRVYSKG